MKLKRNKFGMPAREVSASALAAFDPTGFLDAAGQILIQPAAAYAAKTVEWRGIFGNLFGFYSFPTEELVAYLKDLIEFRSAIEIGSGNGVLAAALGIPATDSRQQEVPEIAALYEFGGMPVVRYGENVETLNYRQAIEKYRPEVVIACWVTHKWDANRPKAKGNQFGIDEEWVLANCKTYVHVGNCRTHNGKSILRRRHTTFRPPWLYSRAMNGSPNEILIWTNP